IRRLLGRRYASRDDRTEHWPAAWDRTGPDGSARAALRGPARSGVQRMVRTRRAGPVVPAARRGRPRGRYAYRARLARPPHLVGGRRVAPERVLRLPLAVAVERASRHD